MKGQEKTQTMEFPHDLWGAMEKNEQVIACKWPKPCVYVLSEAEHDEVRSLCEEIPTPKMKELDNSSLWQQIYLLSDELPRNLRSFLSQFKLRSNEWGSVIVRNLPSDKGFVPTPATDDRFANYDFGIFSKAIALLSARFGYPRAYRDEKNSLVLQPVYPKLGDEIKQENSSSLSFLEDHTEDGFLEEFCDFLLLGCVRPDQERMARTGVACSWQAINKVEWKIIDVLRQPRFVVTAPSSFGGNAPLDSRPVPVLSGDPRRPKMIYDLAAMRGEDDVAKLALKQFGEALRKVHYSEVLLSSDCLIVDNQTSAHTRSSFQPHFDEYDRWLLRLKLFSDPRACASNRLADSLMCGSIAFDMPIAP